MKGKFGKKLISLILSIVLIMSCLPLTAFAAEDAAFYDRIADVNTMDNWKNYFDTENLTTANAGGVWTDKSVFTDASAFGSNIKMIDDSKNFLTALSAIAANKEVVGYSTVPTDTILVLDVSGSMSSNAVTQLVAAANNAIKSLQATNNNNRVGVVLYSGMSANSTENRTYPNAISRLLPLDRYTSTAQNGNFITYSGGTVSVNSRYVSGTKQNVTFGSKSRGGATYIQAGLWEAYKMFNEVPDSEIVIGENNWQTGEYRMPIVVLMSDGAPTMGASDFDNVEEQTYGTWNTKGADFGDGNDTNITVGQGFLVQLTASYIKNRIENKYRIHDENGAGRSLFYTLGFNLGSISGNTARNTATSVLNPDATTVTDSLWNTYNDKSSNTMQVSVKGRNGGSTNITIDKSSYATSKSYVDEYFSASEDGLTTAFESLVEEIILQSRYYPTHLEGGSPDFSGYVEFTDTLGEYMEVKHINGILLGDTLYDGHMMASKLADTSSDGLGTPDSPTDLGNEFIRSVKTRLGISETADAQALVANAFASDQLKYNGPDDWSNYIGWYAKADGTYLKHWDESATSIAPADAVYKIRSYGFLGETTGSIKNSDMMYMTVQVKTNIETGKETVSWKIPASLVPMVTYLVSLNGTNVDTATDVEISVENAENIAPIRLVYETGLRSDLNEFNITKVAGNSINDTSRITDERHIGADGHTRLFWNNSYDITSTSHDQHKVSLAEFTPNKENERFYYTFDSAVHKKTGENTYSLVTQNEGLNADGEYYHRRYIFVEGKDEPQFFYERMSKQSVVAAINNGWVANFKPYGSNVATGAYVVPKGTPARELDMYDEQKSDTDSIDTKSAHMVFHPYLTEHNNTYYVDMNLGNNGLLAVTPATGIKISKTIDIFETGTSDTFKFRITADTSGTFESWITALDETPSKEPVSATLRNGVYEFEMKRNETFWLSGLPAGTKYTIEEISDNADYKIKSVHVNGVSTGTMASGTVSQYLIDDVDFVNTAIGEGDLVITKKVIDQNGREVDISDNIEFTAEVTLTNASGAAVSGTFASTGGNITVGADGKFTVALKEGESFVVRKIPEETRYSVREINIPRGFSLSNAESSLSGIVDSTANDEALIVNEYLPISVNGGDISVVINKEITGRNQWLQGESYSFSLERLDNMRNTSAIIATATIDYNDSDKAHLFSLANESFNAAGTYYYRITEAEGTQGGITYDTAERRFSVTVADSDMDGDLEITAVNNDMNTTVSGNWIVTAAFNNVYAATGSATARIDIKKQFTTNHSLSGYQFALYDEDPSNSSEVNEIIRSGLTDANGNANITLSFAANTVGNTYTYYLAEIGKGQLINNISYSTEVYEVKVTVKDNLDGTISTETVISGLPQMATVPTFTNTYVPSSSDYVTIFGQKVINGDRILNANEFEFELIAKTQGAPMPSTTSVKNMANGYFVFPAIEFKDGEEGTYEYEIREVDTNKIGGFSYDNTVYTVTVTVTDNGNQQIKATAVISNGTSNVDNIVFTNTYDPTDAKVILKGTKLLTGKTIQSGEFDFLLQAVTQGAPMPVDAVVHNNEKGEIIFGEITFTKAGVYNYTLTEPDLNDDRYDCDESVYQVKITVTDNSEGLLSANVELSKNGMPSSEIVFNNGFTPTPISYDIYADFGGLKELLGRPLIDGEFEFRLINAINGQQIGEAVKNDASGAFRFPQVTLATTGIHHFKIVEVIGDEKGVTYDNSSYHIRIEVIQDANGELDIPIMPRLYKGIVTKEMVGGVLTEVTTYEELINGEKIKFTNTYKADPAYVTLEALKTLEGRKLNDGEFKFDLHKTDDTFDYSENTVVQNDVVLNLKDDGTGSITFMALPFDTVGTYYYVIVEDELDEKGITSDKTAHKVEITVTDNHQGNLVAALKINGESVTGSTADKIKFLNTYEAKATEIVIKGQKTLNGRELKDGEFSFELYDGDEKKETVKNKADGSFEFSAIPVDKAGEYLFTVRETKGEAEGITYDENVYTVKAIVTDNLDGTFKVEYIYAIGNEAANGLTFINLYTAPTPPPVPTPESPETPYIPQTGESNNLFMWLALLFISGGFVTTTVILKRLKKDN